MKAALLADRSVVKVAGDDARDFLHGLVSADVLTLTAGQARFCALLTPQGKIIADFIVVAAPAALGGGFLLDVPRTLTATLVQKLNLYKLRSRVMVEDLSGTLAVVAAWDGDLPPYPRAQTAEGAGLAYADPRLPALGLRLMAPPHLAAAAAAELGAELVAASAYEGHRIARGIPSGGVDFGYGDAFPHEADMDQLGGVDFTKGCFVGQEVVSRMEHRGIARTRTVPVRFDGDATPAAGAAVMAGERQVGTMGSAAEGHGLALLRLDRVADAVSAGVPLFAGGIAIYPLKPDWARFAIPGESKAAE
jgi:folate-binding protein YgfZ